MGERRNNDCQQNGQTREQAIRPRPGPEDQATPDRRRAKGHMAHGLLPAGRVPSLRVPWGEQQPRQRNGSTCFICSTVLAAVTLVLAKRPGPVPVVGGQSEYTRERFHALSECNACTVSSAPRAHWPMARPDKSRVGKVKQTRAQDAALLCKGCRSRFGAKSATGCSSRRPSGHYCQQALQAVVNLPTGTCAHSSPALSECGALTWCTNQQTALPPNRASPRVPQLAGTSID